MGKRFYIIHKEKGCVEAEHETRLLCETHIRNAQSLFGNDPTNYAITEGAKERDEVLKLLKKNRR